jgi:hypothetical protein
MITEVAGNGGNDEIRMTNDESNPNDQMTNDRNTGHIPAAFVSVIRHFPHSNLIRHSGPLNNSLANLQAGAKF